MECQKNMKKQLRLMVGPLPISVTNDESMTDVLSPCVKMISFEFRTMLSPDLDMTPRHFKSIEGNPIDLTGIESGHVVCALRSI